MLGTEQFQDAIMEMEGRVVIKSSAICLFSCSGDFMNTYIFDKRFRFVIKNKKFNLYMKHEELKYIDLVCLE